MQMLFSLIVYLSLPGSDQPSMHVMGDADAAVDVVWDGGQLTLEELIHLGGLPQHPENPLSKRQVARFCRTVFEAIYANQARSLGLHRTEFFARTCEKWRKRTLFRAYRKRHEPGQDVVFTESQLRACYDREKVTRFTESARVDLKVLFVASGSERSDRSAALRHIRDLRQQIVGGQRMNALVKEERKRSGPANGVFQGVDPQNLLPVLARVVDETPEGERSGIIETPIGFYLIQVVRKAKPRVKGFDEVKAEIVREMGQQVRRDWRHEQRTEWKAERAVSDHAGPRYIDAVYEVACREKLDQDPSFLAQEAAFKRKTLANQAFLRDRLVLPTDAELNAEYMEELLDYQEYLLIAAFIEPVDDYSAIATARRMGEQLEAAPDPRKLFLGLESRFPDVRLVFLEPMRISAIERLNASLARQLTSMSPNGWTTPVAMDFEELDPKGTLSEKSVKGVALFFLDVTRMPSLDEVREKLYLVFLAQKTADLNPFMASFGRRWNVQLSPRLQKLLGGQTDPASVDPLTTQIP